MITLQFTAHLSVSTIARLLDRHLFEAYAPVDYEFTLTDLEGDLDGAMSALKQEIAVRGYDRSISTYRFVLNKHQVPRLAKLAQALIDRKEAELAA